MTTSPTPRHAQNPSKIKPKIRALTDADTSRVATLLARTYGAEGVQAIEMFGKLRRDSHAKQAYYLVAEHLGDVVASAMFYPIELQDESGQIAGLVLAQFSLDPQHQAIDFTNLLQLFFAHVQKSSYKILILHGFLEEMAALGFQQCSDFGLVLRPELADQPGAWLVASLQENHTPDITPQTLVLPKILQ